MNMTVVSGFIFDVLCESIVLLIEMSPYLMLGLLVAGILNIFMSGDFIKRHIGSGTFSSVVKAAVFGVPMPLCSCGVIPTAGYLKSGGASKSAVVSFLIATPQTGVDSILATYGLLGPLFAVFRPLAALIMGLAGGTAATFLPRDPLTAETPRKTYRRKRTFKEKLYQIYTYSFHEFLDDIAVQFVVGLLISGLITVMIPDDYFSGKFYAGGIMGMLTMLVLAVPMYVCATSSIPIALALITKGFSPGAAYVFLVTGPATNAATIAVLLKVIKKKATVIYLITIIVLGFGFGILFDTLFPDALKDVTENLHHHRGHEEKSLLFYGTAAVFVIFLFRSLFFSKMIPFLKSFGSGKRSAKHLHKKSAGAEGDENAGKLYASVKGMTCHHCQKNVHASILSVEGVTKAEVSLETGQAIIEGDFSFENIRHAVFEAGYTIEKT